MVETSDIINEGSDRFKDGLHRMVIAGETGGIRLGAGAAKSEVGAASHYAFADMAVAGAALSAGITQWDYVHARDNLRRQYELEIAARTGKPPHEINNKDLDAMGRQSAAVGDALRRARVRRNIALVAGVAAVVAAAAIAGPLTTIVASHLAGWAGVSSALVEGGSVMSALGMKYGAAASAAVLGKAIAVGAAGIATYMGVEEGITKVAKPLFGMKEPHLRQVMKEPSLQNKLSLSSQINYIEYLQKRVHAQKPATFISQEQVLKVFLAANTQAAEAVKNTYGKDFSSLPPEQRVQVIQTLGKQVNLEQITSDLNHHQIRAQELAFLIQGESSGVPRHEAPRVTALEKAHVGMQHELQKAREEISRLRMAIHPKSTQLGSTSGMGQYQEAANDPAPMMQEPGAHAQRELARRQQTALRQAGGVGS